MDIELLEIIWHLISSSIIFTIGLLALLKFKNKAGVSTHLTIFIYLWHTLFSMIYMIYTFYGVADASGYYEVAKSGDNIRFALGSPFIELFTYILVSVLNLSYLGIFLIFNIFGSIGLFIFCSILLEITTHCTKRIRHAAVLIILLPSMSFWSSALGKEPIAFLSVTLTLWAALNLQKRKIFMAIAIILMLLVRPHIAGIMIIAMGLSLFISSKQINLAQQAIIGALLIPITITLVPFAANYAGIERLSNINEVIEYIETRQGSNLEGGSSLDIKSMSPPVQVFTYLFRPLPYEAHNIFSLFSSLDNIILLLLFLYTIRFIHNKSNNHANHAFLWLYVIISTLVLSMTTANLGISMRQKWMLMPILIYLLFAGIAAHQAQKQRKKIAQMHATRFLPT